MSLKNVNPDRFNTALNLLDRNLRKAQPIMPAFWRIAAITFFQNINLNWSVGKAVVRPWADKGGRIATNSTTFNRELLIVEKENDGKPFQLHTTYEDKQDYIKNMRKPWLFLFIVSAVLGIAMRQLVWGIFAVISLIGLIVFQLELRKLKKKADIKEM